MKLTSIAAITAAITISSIGLAQAADPVKVYASHTKGERVGENTLDGDFSSRWVSKGDGEYIQYKFEEAVTLEAIKLAFFKGDLRKSSFRIESTDTPWSATPNWQQQELMESSGVSNDLETFELASPVTAQFFRIVGHGFVSKWGWQGTVNGITEAEFVDYEDDKPIVIAEICGQSASTEDGENVASNVVDDDFGTRWSGNSDVANATLTLELCEEATISGVSAAFHKGDERSHDFSIEVSNDNATWSEALSQTTTENDTLEMQDFAFPEEVSATYIRYTGYGNSGGSSWNSVTELTVCQGDECGTPPIDCSAEPEHPSCIVDCDETPNDPSCPDLCEVNPDDASCNATAPSDLMRNFDQWKITLPIEDPNDPGDAWEIKPLEGVTNEYFYVNEEQTGIVFYAPINEDNFTTGGSSYIRSELRERTPDGSADIYWTTEGKHVVYSKQAITHLPIVKDELVATQIHGDKSEGIDDALVLRLEGEHLFLSFNGGKLAEDLTVKTDYVLGTTHEIMFEVIDGKHYVYYSEDGNLNAAYAAGTAAGYLVKRGDDDFVMDKDYGSSYFKIGNYTQSNMEKEGDEGGKEENYGEVIVYDFWVNHEE